MSKFRTLHPDDPEFTLVDGLMVSHRAGIEIMSNCPKEYTQIILECLRRGWLEPVAVVYEHELTFNLLKD